MKNRRYFYIVYDLYNNLNQKVGSAWRTFYTTNNEFFAFREIQSENKGYNTVIIWWTEFNSEEDYNTFKASIDENN